MNNFAQKLANIILSAYTDRAAAEQVVAVITKDYQQQIVNNQYQVKAEAEYIETNFALLQAAAKDKDLSSVLYRAEQIKASQKRKAEAEQHISFATDLLSILSNYSEQQQ